MLTRMKTVLIEKAEYYIDPAIKPMLDRSVQLVRDKDWDRVFLIDGSEGTGKSLLALQLASYVDKSFNLDRVVFTGQAFSNAIDKAEKNQAIIFDEAFNGLSSTGALSDMNRLIVRKLMECRQKNLFIFIVLPTIFLLQKYAAIFRSHVLFHVYATKKGDRGYYKVYNRKNKKKLFLQGLKMYSYTKPWIAKSRRFYGKYPVDEVEYRRKKLAALQSNEISAKEDKYVDKFHKCVALLKSQLNLSDERVSKLLEANGIDLKKTQINIVSRRILLKQALP